VKTAWIVCMAIAAELSIPVHGCALSSEPTVIVYLQSDASVPVPELRRAQGIAAGIFSRIGVHLEWRRGAPREGGKSAKCLGQLVEAIEVSLDREAPSSSHPGALAYAALDKTSGVRVHIFYNRVAARGHTWNITSALLGHVLAHEITHVLCNAPGHSTSGLMKAHWEKADFDEMALRSLPLADVDVNLIRTHFAQLAGAASAITVAANPNPAAHTVETE
jgi:hypothetical protein